LLSQEVVPEEQKLFFRDFVLWLCGKPIDRDDLARTPWLRQAHNRERWDFLRHVVPGEDVHIFLKALVAARERFAKQLDHLKIGFKGGLLDSYLYFKYIIRQGNGGILNGTGNKDPLVDRWIGDLRVMDPTDPDDTVRIRGPDAPPDPSDPRPRFNRYI